MILKKIFFKLMKNVGKWKNCKKSQRYKTCLNRKKKKLFAVRINLSYYKVFHRVLLAIEMKKRRHL